MMILGNIWTVNQLFDQILEDRKQISDLKKYVKELEAVENRADALLANSVENLSKQILLIEKSINDKIDKINEKIKYL